MKYLFIEIEIQDGENNYTQRVLHTTNAKHTLFAAQRYVATFLGCKSERLVNALKPKKVYDCSGWWYTPSLERACKLCNVQELTKREYVLMSEVFAGNKNRNSNHFRVESVGFDNNVQTESVVIRSGLHDKIFIDRAPQTSFVVINFEREDEIVQSMTVFDENINVFDNIN